MKHLLALLLLVLLIATIPFMGVLLINLFIYVLPVTICIGFLICIFSSK